MTTTMVELAKLLCPRPETVAREVEIALDDPVRYVATHAKALRFRGVDRPVEGLAVLALIEHDLAAELDWRESPHASSSRSRAARPAAELVAPELDDDVGAEQALQVAAGALAPRFVLATVDIRSDSYPVVVMDADAFMTVAKQAASCNVRLAPVPAAEAPPRKPVVTPPSPSETIGRYLAEIDARVGDAARRSWVPKKDALYTSLIAAMRGHGELPAGFDPDGP